MRSHFNKIHTNRIFIKLIPQKQIVCANVKIERNFNKQFQRWFPFSTLYIAEMFETDVEFFGTFPVSYLGLYEVLSNALQNQLSLNCTKLFSFPPDTGDLKDPLLPADRFGTFRALRKPKR